MSFDAGPIAFSGTTTSITMFPPYQFESTGQGAPFLGGAELKVQASGATGAGFDKFDETFTATTFLQTTPSLSKLTKSQVFGTGSLPIAWAPANDTILISISGAGGTATCKVQDSLGKFDVPRSVVKAAQGDTSSTTDTGNTSLSISVARQKKDVKKDQHAKGTLDLVSVKPDGWLELVTLSTESASFQGCGTGQDFCGDTCTDLSLRPAELRRLRQRLFGQPVLLLRQVRRRQQQRQLGRHQLQHLPQQRGQPARARRSTRRATRTTTATTSRSARTRAPRRAA